MSNSRQQPPPHSFPQPVPYATHWSPNPAQNEASYSARPQDGLPPGHFYPPGGFLWFYTLGLPIEPRLSLVDNARISPSQGYSSPHPPPSRRSTAPTDDHASSFPRQPGPPPLGSVPHYQSSPARYASMSSSSHPPPVTQRAATISMPVHSNIAPSMPYGMSPHPPPRSDMSRGSQPSSQSWSYRAYAAYISVSCE